MRDDRAVPKTYLNHPNQKILHDYLHDVLSKGNFDYITDEFATFLRENPVPLDDFPRMEGTYTRTILLREDNGFEVMVARWSRGALSTIHGHPYFNYVCVAHGAMNVDDYSMTKDGLVLIESGCIQSGEDFFHRGERETFDNNIHQVHAIEETLSIHISSDDSAKGQVFD